MNIWRICISFILISILYLNGTVDQVKAEELQNNVVRLDNLTEKIVLDEHIEVLILEDFEQTVDEIASGKYDDKFKRYEGKGRPNFGYNFYTYWVRIHIDNQSDIENWLLEMSAPKTNEFHIHILDNETGQFETIRTGNDYPFLERKIKHRNYLTPVEIKAGETKTVYFMVYTGSSVQIPLTLWDPTAYQTKAQNEYAILGGLLGLSVVMALYNLFIYFSIRDRSYLYYVLFVMLNTLLFLVDTGLSYHYLWPSQVSKDALAVTELMYLSNIGGLLFIRSFLSIHKRMRKIDRIFKLFITLNIIGFIIRQITTALSVYTAAILVVFSIFIILYSSTQSLRSGFRPARYILMAWGFFLCGVFISLMVDVGLIPLTLFTKYAWQMTTALEVILLSFALGDKYKTYREEKEQAVQETNEMQQEVMKNMKKTDKLKDEFLTITSHELQTPLNGIIGIAETMQDGAVGSLNTKMDSHLSMIIASGRRLSHLINDVLDYANLKNDQLKMKFSSVRIYEITNIVLTICQPLLRNKPIQLINKISSQHGLTVYADESRVQQILYNLIGNAIKYTEKGTVTISALVEKGFIRINITDTGKGIPYHKQKDIFKQFYQVESGEARGFEGSGIGLNITQGLVEQHGGELTVDSIVNKGSTFSFTLPIYQGKEVRKEITATIDAFSEPESSVPTETLQLKDTVDHKGTILITDDDPVNLQVLMNQLHLEGYEVITASSGQEVLKIVQYETIDLLILDIMMPQMSGYEVCQHLRNEFTLIDLPILMLTAKTQLKDKIIAFEVGANDYLKKPCDRKELLTRVNTLIQLSRLNDELKSMNVVLEEKVKQRTEELQIANHDLKQMAESRTLLLANIAHDLGTPITVIYNYIQAFDIGIIDETENKEYLGLVYNKINVLNRLISDLFDLSKLEAQQFKLDVEELNVKKSVDRLRESMKIEMIQMDCRFTFKSEDIHPHFSFFIDEQRMDQVFSNLMRNAINHTDSMDSKIDVKVKLNKDNSEVIFQIADNGIGISDELIPFIFERYYKVPTMSGKHGGAGIGLAIVKELVQAHQGRVWVESKLHVGSMFYVALPIQENTDLNY